MWQHSLDELLATWNENQPVSKNIFQSMDLHNQYATSPTVSPPTPNDGVVLLVACFMTADKKYSYVPVLPIVDPSLATTHILWLVPSCKICLDVIHEALSLSSPFP